jgi:hypothetical protein
MTASEDGRTRALADYLDAYLSPEHRDNVAEGCPMTAAASEIARQDRAVGARFSEGFERTVGVLQTAIVGGTTASTAAARQRSLTLATAARWRWAKAFAPILAANGAGRSSTCCLRWPGSVSAGPRPIARPSPPRGRSPTVYATSSAPKASPDDVALQTLQALEAGREEILADDVSRQVKPGLSADRGIYLGDPA